jgi:hypothetical protein
MQSVPLGQILGPTQREKVTEMDDTSAFSPIYSGWFGKPVVLLFVIRQCHIPLPCRIVGESVTALRIQLQPGWEVDVRKELILAVEEFGCTPDTCMN